MWRRTAKAILLGVLIINLTGCQQNKVTNLVPEVINTYPHDAIAFTQGLLLHEASLFESTGLYGQSDLREVELETGVVKRLLRLDENYFAEGLAKVGSKLYQITETEGWGLCFDGEHLYMTDGSSTLFQRDPESFEILKELTVTQDKAPRTNLNELECVGDHIYANVWLTDEILKIDKSSGRVVATIDASRLLTNQDRASLNENAVLNGIAYNEASDSFYLTGKLWPKLFEVRFVEKN